MPFEFDQPGEGRLREPAGLDFEDFAAGQRFRHLPGITMRQDENVNEALASLNQARIHFDEHHAGGTEFRRPLVVSTLTVQRAIGLGWKTFGRRKRILGWQSIRLPHPIFGGDTVHAASTVLACDPAPAGEPDCGGLTVETTLTNQDGAEVCTMVWDCLVFRRGRPGVGGTRR